MASEENEGLVLKLELHSDPEMLCVVRGAVQQLAEVAGLPEAECRSVTLAVDEALTNIIRHAYQGQGGRPSQLSCRYLGPAAPGRPQARLVLVLVARGRGVDPPELRKVLLAGLREERAPRVIVNLREVRYTDSSGVASLVEGLKVSRELGSRLVLLGLSQAVRDVLELSRLNKLSEVCDTEEQALRS